MTIMTHKGLPPAQCLPWDLPEVGTEVDDTLAQHLRRSLADWLLNHTGAGITKDDLTGWVMDTKHLCELMCAVDAGRITDPYLVDRWKAAFRGSSCKPSSVEAVLGDSRTIGHLQTAVGVVMSGMCRIARIELSPDPKHPRVFFRQGTA